MPALPGSMRAMVFDSVGESLRAAELPLPEPAAGQLLLRVRACGVCRTDLHLLLGEVPVRNPPRVFGHQVVATVVEDGRRVGVPWLGWTDGTCPQCVAGRENLCEHALFTGADIDGGYAEYLVADERFCLPIPGDAPDVEVAPLLCAGLIGYRALCLAGENAARIGFYGFGSAAHILTQLAVWQNREIYAFTRPGDTRGQDFAREVGASWAGGSDEPAPEPLDAAIIFASVGELIPPALRAVRPGGSVVCGGIHMTDIPRFAYDILWGERILRSVANLTRTDGHEFLALAAQADLRTHVTTYPLEGANKALSDLRDGKFVGAAVLVP